MELKQIVVNEELGIFIVQDINIDRSLTIKNSFPSIPTLDAT